MKRKWRILYLVLVITLLTSLTGFGSISNVTAADTAAATGSTDEIINDRLKGAVTFYTGSMYSLVDNELKVIDPENELITPFIQNNRMMVPIRFIAESFGAEVSWDQATQTAMIDTGDKTIKIKLYSTRMTVGNNTITLDVPAMSTGDRTFIPLRAVGEALGKTIFYERGLVVLSNTSDIFDTVNEKQLVDEIIGTVNILPTVGTREKLVELLGETGDSRGNYPLDFMKSAESGEAAVATDSAASQAPTSAAPAIADGSAQGAGVDYSETNVQVEGVDEADIVKTDGSYIYQVSNNNILIYKAYPAAEMKLAGSIIYTDGQFTPQELYIKGNQLVIIGSAWSYGYGYETGTAVTDPAGSMSKVSSLYPIYNNTSSVKAFIYDVTDRSKPVKSREVSLQGNYVSSRLIGNDLYFVSNNSIYYWGDEVLPLNPQYTDSITGTGVVTIPYDKIGYMPPIVNSSYLMIAGLSLDDSAKPMNVGAWLGAGEEIYVSQDNLYVSVNEGYGGIRPMRIMADGFLPPLQQEATLIYKFSLKDATVTYQSRGQVPGTILNQFSMDENNDTFRIATTLGQSWWSGESSSSNNVYILDSNLNITGKLEDLAKGERIYSVRFMGKRAYVVTFRTVDPLFVIDLADPYKPSVLGALKIPGYSDYLHPYDENHIIGFGKDTITVSQKDSSGNVVDTTAFYLGMKVALFDVSDVTNPVVQSEIKIGDRGTDSELLNDHKALLFDKEKQLLAFPVNEAKVDGPVIDPYSGYPNYGQLAFSGAYVYNLNLEDGFVLKGKISHLATSDYLKSGYYNADYNKQIRRMLYIGDVLYGVSNSILSAHDMASLKELGKVTGN